MLVNYSYSENNLLTKYDCDSCVKFLFNHLKKGRGQVKQKYICPNSKKCSYGNHGCIHNKAMAKINEAMSNNIPNHKIQTVLIIKLCTLHIAGAQCAWFSGRTCELGACIDSRKLKI